MAYKTAATCSRIKDHLEPTIEATIEAICLLSDEPECLRARLKELVAKPKLYFSTNPIDFVLGFYHGATANEPDNTIKAFLAMMEEAYLVATMDKSVQGFEYLKNHFLSLQQGVLSDLRRKSTHLETLLVKQTPTT